MDTVRHHDVKLAWLNGIFLRGSSIVAYSKSALMLVDCSIKPSTVLNCSIRFLLLLESAFILIVHNNTILILTLIILLGFTVSVPSSNSRLGSRLRYHVFLSINFSDR